MQAKITKQNYDGKIKQHRKENNRLLNEYAVLLPEKRKEYVREGNIMRSPIIARLYAVPSAQYGFTIHACVWINSATDKKPVYISGGGKASGCGYHKASAALQAAINDAGIVLSESIAGVGDSAINDALIAIAKALGFKRFHIHVSHA